MTQVFDEKGVVSPATVIAAGPLTVTQVKTDEKDGYAATQFGFGARAEKNVRAPQRGHLKDLTLVRTMRESRGAEGMERGATVDVSIFTPGDMVAVSAISKGKGFQGVVKRHGFHGGPRSHGQKNKERSPGSISGAGRAGGGGERDAAVRDACRRHGVPVAVTLGGGYGPTPEDTARLHTATLKLFAGIS